MDKLTTIKVKMSTVVELAKFKIHPRQSNEEVLLRMIELIKDKKLQAYIKDQ